MQEIDQIDQQITALEQTVTQLNADIENLTNNSDGFDYAISVASGIISGMIDSFFVGELSFEEAQKKGKAKVDKHVIRTAQRKGYKGNDLEGAVRHLEKKYPLVSDKVENDFGGGKGHHLRDFSHHPTPIGLFFSLLTQFTKKAYGTDKTGKFIVVDIPDSAFMLIGKNLPEKITFGVINWFFHMVSDMSGSSGSIAEGKYGTGLPGPLVSLLKEVSSLNIFKKTKPVKIGGQTEEYKVFSVWISKLFNGTLLAQHDENGKIIKGKEIPFDLRTEVGVKMFMRKQAIPVLINECVVRGFYFIRRLYLEIKGKGIQSISDLGQIDWKNTLPVKNRTIIRMLTISTGTFVAVDAADAAICSAIESGGIAPGFAVGFVLRLNYVGIGRFAIAVSSDIKMGVEKAKKTNDRIRIKNQIALFGTAKVYYRLVNANILLAQVAEIEEQEWKALTLNKKKMIELQSSLDAAMFESLNAYEADRKSMRHIGEMIPSMEKHNPGLAQDILDCLK